jgi:hypothetical protein
MASDAMDRIVFDTNTLVSGSTIITDCRDAAE